MCSRTMTVEAGWDRGSVIRILIGSLMLACTGVGAFAKSPSVDKQASSSMRFEWHGEAPAGHCGKVCRVWISAVGPITERTLRDFETFRGKRDVRGAILVLDSEGGSVVDTIELGRALRRLDITTTVGKTVTVAATDGKTKTALSPAASCESMCAFALLGGARRNVPREARVLVHQIWLTKKREGAETGSYTADELVTVEHDIGSLAHYTIEMGGGIELLETALRVPPWEPLYRLSSDEIRRMGLNNVDRLFDAEVPDVATTSGSGASLAKAPPPRFERD